MLIIRRAAAFLAPAILALAEPPPVKMTLGPACSELFHRVEETARKLGLPLSADQIATCFATMLERFGELAAEDPEAFTSLAQRFTELAAADEPELDELDEHILARLDNVERCIDTTAPSVLLTRVEAFWARMLDNLVHHERRIDELATRLGRHEHADMVAVVAGLPKPARPCPYQPASGT